MLDNIFFLVFQGGYQKFYILHLACICNSHYSSIRQGWSIPPTYQSVMLLQVPSNLEWRPYLNVSCVGKEFQACRLPTCNIALHTDLAKDKCMLEAEIKHLGEQREEVLGKGSSEQHNWFSLRLQYVHKNPSAGNPQGLAVSITNKLTLPFSGRLQTTALQDRR